MKRDGSAPLLFLWSCRGQSLLLRFRSIQHRCVLLGLMIVCFTCVPIQIPLDSVRLQMLLLSPHSLTVDL